MIKINQYAKIELNFKFPFYKNYSSFVNYSQDNEMILLLWQNPFSNLYKRKKKEKKTISPLSAATDLGGGMGANTVGNTAPEIWLSN